MVVLLPGSANADEVRDGQWYLDTLGILEAHELSQGAGVTIGVIDSGVDAEHPDLKDSVLPGTDFGTSKGEGLEPGDDHGTATASVIVGHGHGNDHADGVLGIAPEARVISVGIDWDNPAHFNNEWIPQAVKWLVDNGADIISISMGSAPGSTGPFKYATDNGVPIVASVGNTTDDESLVPGEELSGTSWPARAKGIIPVTGVDRNGDFWEESLDLQLASAQPQLGLTAPAIDIPTAVPGGGYDTKRGTSFSAPIVAGTLALIKSAYPDLSIQQLNERLLLTTDDKGSEGYDYEYGWGIVNPLTALTDEVDHYEGSPSGPDDRLPLEEQGQQTGDEDNAPGGNGDNGDDSAQTDDDQPLVAASNAIPTWAWATVAATAVLAAAIIAAVLIRRRNRTPTGHRPGGAVHHGRTSLPHTHDINLFQERQQ